jgi:hypothetical protein
MRAIADIQSPVSDLQRAAQDAALAVWRITRALPLHDRFRIGARVRLLASELPRLAAAVERAAGAERARAAAALRQAVADLRAALAPFAPAGTGPLERLEWALA